MQWVGTIIIALSIHTVSTTVLTSKDSNPTKNGCSLAMMNDDRVSSDCDFVCTRTTNIAPILKRSITLSQISKE
jgi:hypothetical protein